MSARSEGSWKQFRAAVEEFHVESKTDGDDGEAADESTASDLPVYQAVRLELQRLGHVEFFSIGTDKNWRVVPPVLATIQGGNQCIGIACGARSPVLYERLNQVRGSVSYDALKVPGMPDRLRLLASELEELCASAQSVGFLVQENAPFALLSAIPPVDDSRTRIPAEPPAGVGWVIEKFASSTLCWTEVERKSLNEGRVNFFRFRMRHQRFHFLWWQGRMYKVPVQVGKYAVLRRRRRQRLLKYDSQRAMLSVPAICRPPLLIERALVLCSGLLPRFDQSSSRVEYIDVPWDVARVAAQLLRQEIEKQ